MKDSQIHAQYSTGLSRQNIEQALITAGKDLDHLQPADLGLLLEDFHTIGRIATSELVDIVEITSEHEVLDAGSGIGGTARYVADRCGCRVTAVDLTDEYCETACWLNRLVGLDKRITVRRADVTARPFADATFRVVFSQHVQMNVADKARLYREARRVMVSGGRLAMWDIVSGERDDADHADTASQPARTARLRPRLRGESQEPHHCPRRRTATSDPGRGRSDRPLGRQEVRPRGWLSCSTVGSRRRRRRS
jgi:sarcosine/dimethylglycine N-methyltransferase